MPVAAPCCFPCGKEQSEWWTRSPAFSPCARRSDATPTGYDCRALMSRHIRGTLLSPDVISHDACAVVYIQRTRSPRASAPRMALDPAHPFRKLTSRKNHDHRVSKLLPTEWRPFYRCCLHPLDSTMASLKSVNSDTVHDDANTYPHDSLTSAH